MTDSVGPTLQGVLYSNEPRVTVLTQSATDLSKCCSQIALYSSCHWICLPLLGFQLKLEQTSRGARFQTPSCKSGQSSDSVMSHKPMSVFPLPTSSRAPHYMVRREKELQVTKLRPELQAMVFHVIHAEHFSLAVLNSNKPSYFKVWLRSHSDLCLK